MTSLPTDPHRPRVTPGTITLIAVLVLAAVQLLGFAHSAVQSGKRDQQIKTLQSQLDAAQGQLSQALTALATDDATLAQVREGLAALARQKHITPADIRRLEHRAAPKVIVSPVPGPTVTVTRSAHPPASKPIPHPTHRKATPTPCMTIPVAGRCLPTISIR